MDRRVHTYGINVNERSDSVWTCCCGFVWSFLALAQSLHLFVFGSSMTLVPRDFRFCVFLVATPMSLVWRSEFGEAKINNGRIRRVGVRTWYCPGPKDDWLLFTICGETEKLIVYRNPAEEAAGHQHSIPRVLKHLVIGIVSFVAVGAVAVAVVAALVLVTLLLLLLLLSLFAVLPVVASSAVHNHKHTTDQTHAHTHTHTHPEREREREKERKSE